MQAQPAQELEGVATTLRAHGARFAFVHGSAAVPGATAPGDIDVAAWFGDARVDGLAVAAALPGWVDLLTLDRAPLELGGRVALTGRLLFEDDPPVRVRWQAQTRKLALDERHRVERAARTSWRDAVVDPERLHRLLRGVTEDLAWLRRYAAVVRAELLADPARLGHTKYLFVTALEGCVDVGHHVVASEGWRVPDTNADAMRALAEHDVIVDEVARSMAKAVGFRNLLVHNYAEVDDERVADYLNDLGDLDRFVTALTALLED
ncbi:MAG: DUF86 domain-containing protein [Euzebyales bacterium]|nr:DUF86 domain-containing protein [Euzebyales bacterium]